ncbi:MAG: hypothetical protein CMJ76_03880 [Planctomycetaceae bacterium]|nr:hypothetical protein [Planctomycetaceae bacterium]
MLRTLLFGAVVGVAIMLSGCQSEDQRETAQQQREAEAEQTLEDLFGELAEALEEASPSEMSPIGKVVRKAQKLSNTAFNEVQSGEKNAYKKYADACNMIMELVEKHEKTELIPYANAIYVILYNGACAYSINNDVEKALSTFKLAVEYGWDDVDHTMSDPDLVNLRATGGFKEFIIEMETIAERIAAENLPAEESFPFDFSLTSINDKPLSLADYKGKVVIVDFWGTWCPPCRAEIPSFIKLQEEFGEQGFQMIGLNYEGGSAISDKEKVKNYVSSEGINYPCALGDDATQQQVPDFNAYPTTLFIDKKGKVRYRLVGLHSYKDLSAIVRKLLTE